MRKVLFQGALTFGLALAAFACSSSSTSNPSDAGSNDSGSGSDSGPPKDGGSSGDGGGGGDAATNTILGDWKGTQGAAATVLYTYTLKLTGAPAAGTATLVYEAQQSTGGGFILAGCKTVENLTGTFTATSSAIDFTFTSGDSERTDCDDGSKDKAKAALADFTDQNTVADGQYTLEPTKLTITPAQGGAIALTRQ